MQVFKEGKYQNLPVRRELEMLLEQLFAVMPNLEYHASGIGRYRHSNGDFNEFISNVFVFDGEQKLGVIAFGEKYTRNGYVWVYKIGSKKIQKRRGSNRSCRETKDLKSALHIAKEVFVKDTAEVIAEKIIRAVTHNYNALAWQAGSKYRDLRNKFSKVCFDYTVSVVDGQPIPIDANMVAFIKSEEFTQIRDTYRIANVIDKNLAAEEGVIVYVDRENKLSVADCQAKTISKLESTYDLPKNYQEKYTILKVMEFNQPIEGIGVKLHAEIDDIKNEYYYLAPGDTIITH